MTPAPHRKRLPMRRAASITHSATVKGHKVIITCGEYEDGSLGEIFINMSKEGSAFRTLMDCFAVLVSLCLQHGVPLKFLVSRFKGIKFEPAGIVRGHETITEADSIIDYIFKLLEHEYVTYKGNGHSNVSGLREEAVQDDQQRSSRRK